MEAASFVDRVEDMTDLELAMLLSLIAEHHCLIEVDDDLLNDLASELALIARDVFSLSYIILERADVQSIDEFVAAILDDNNDVEDPADALEDDSNQACFSNPGICLVDGLSFRGAPSTQNAQFQSDSPTVVNVIIAKDFNFAHDDVQVQALELIRKRRIYSRTTVHVAPKAFLLLPIVSTSSKHVRLNAHLNDRIFMSHYHEAEDGFPNLEEMDIARHSEDESAYSYSHSPSVRREDMIASRRIESELIDQLRVQGKAATVTPEIRRYLQDVVAFLRLARGVDGGVTPYATTLFLALAKYLAPFHGIDYVTPALITLAAKKVYPHRIIMASPTRERSTQYGTNVTTARDLLRDLDPHTVLQHVLDTVECPA
ncbi:hypothetical protein A1O3_04700 [Capronia epimyces CBS 606.96]|uniref:magnesium chelatase n=1 Tax=Capronia epimyces CBS 606.96 TaxID=1182542 RepID=W9XUY4_9EURO|nr:uncharacterized protein A1O3_04700 [Capronia epimyces CBS 606.96]EXJ84033.1 hypothetical protein A1O3_04700 [Capronia epimyces CBS 606.96]